MNIPELRSRVTITMALLLSHLKLVYQSRCDPVHSYDLGLKGNQHFIEFHSVVLLCYIFVGGPRVCAYTKRYYCVECHVNEDSYIPSKIIYNWDFAKYKGNAIKDRPAVTT